MRYLMFVGVVAVSLVAGRLLSSVADDDVQKGPSVEYRLLEGRRFMEESNLGGLGLSQMFLNADQAQDSLNRYAKAGWRVVAMTSDGFVMERVR